MFNRPIFGVGPGDLEASRMATLRQQEAETPMYLPASRLTEQQIHGVGDGGDCWEEWRTMGGEMWYRRNSGESATAEIHGEAPLDDFSPDDDDDSEVDDDTDDILQAFHRDIGIIKSRYARGEITDADNEFGDANDEM